MKIRYYKYPRGVRREGRPGHEQAVQPEDLRAGGGGGAGAGGAAGGAAAVAGPGGAGGARPGRALQSTGVPPEDRRRAEQSAGEDGRRETPPVCAMAFPCLSLPREGPRGTLPKAHVLQPVIIYLAAGPTMLFIYLGAGPTVLARLWLPASESPWECEMLSEQREPWLTKPADPSPQAACRSWLMRRP